MTDIYAEIGETTQGDTRIMLHGLEGDAIGPTMYGDNYTIKTIPGRSWDRKGKRWSLPLSWHSCVVARSVLGDRLKVGPALGAWARSARDRNAEVLALRTLLEPVQPYTPVNDHDERLYPFQIPGADFLVAAKHAILGDEMGCIDGDAKIKVQRFSSTRTMTMRELHYKFHGGESRGRAWDRTKPCRVKSMSDDGSLRLNDIVDVMARGVQSTLRITLESGRSIRCTSDHRMSTGLGTWAEAGSLNVGDTIMVNGVTACIDCGELREVTTYRYAKFLGMCKECVLKHRKPRVGPHGLGRFKDKDGYIMLTQFSDHPNADANGNLREHIKVMSD